MIWAFVGSLLVSLAVMYQLRVNSLWEELPEASSGNLASTQARLAAVTEFMDSHPLWIGSYMERGEQSRLNSELVQLKTAKTIESTREKSDLEDRRLEAESARHRAGSFVLENDYKSAHDALVHALEIAPADWPVANQVRKDLEAIERELEVNR